ncbi:hypothetical protein FKR81_10955 [Lentzea tibetensis]|uniref:Knr4/Smi1-like domain-containing protein n=1 Tax=Lentzea tibetensis TaxID=2591470 RepID=A0A563EY75_9PSEU|nr:SMI1/KNR4 family protein [Lentzea tibetensis]TWP52094.1 hypothetical protein FKR81_10955 [Lentzea tibetensis]
MENQISRIREKLARAAADPALLESFGAQKHSYRLNPPLAEPDVAAFESEHGIVLPAEYRRFVIELGDGGAGPSYGVAPLRESFDWDESPDGFLAAPSHFAPGIAYPVDSWSDDLDEPRQGSLAVVHHGCSDYTQLVVSGPGRGRLVTINLDGWGRPVVAEDPDFLSWYERWLDELLAGCTVTWFGRKLPGGEAELVAIAAHDPSADRRAQAAASLGLLREVGPAGAQALAAAIADPDPLVRECALGAARSRTVEACADPARVALSDPDASVRAEAIMVLRALSAADLPELARRLLSDDDPAVLRRAVTALGDLGELVVADLAPLTTRPDAEIRGSAVHALINAQDDATGLLATALDDEDHFVRIHAVQAAFRRGDRALLPLLRQRLGVETDPTVLRNLEQVVTAWTS